MYGSTWRADVAKAGGGTLIEHSIHDVDVMRWILGDPTDVAARTAARFGHAGIDDVATLTLRYGDGGSADDRERLAPDPESRSSRRLEVFCEEALLWTDDDYLGPLHVQTTDGVELLEPAPPVWIDRLTVPEVYAKPLAQYAEPSKAFLDRLARDGSHARGEPDAEVALAAHRIVDRAYRSAAAGGVPQAVPA